MWQAPQTHEQISNCMLFQLRRGQDAAPLAPSSRTLIPKKFLHLQRQPTPFRCSAGRAAQEARLEQVRQAQQHAPAALALERGQRHIARQAAAICQERVPRHVDGDGRVGRRVAAQIFDGAAQSARGRRAIGRLLICTLSSALGQGRGQGAAEVARGLREFRCRVRGAGEVARVRGGLGVAARVGQAAEGEDGGVVGALLQAAPRGGALLGALCACSSSS